MYGAAGIFQIVGEVEREDVHGEYASPPGTQRRKGFLVGIVPVRGKNNEGIYATQLPGGQHVIHPAVQRLAAHRGVAGVGSLRGRVDAVRDGGRAQDAEACGKVIGQPLDD